VCVCDKQMRACISVYVCVHAGVCACVSVYVGACVIVYVGVCVHV